jgi:hypothetical protein
MKNFYCKFYHVDKIKNDIRIRTISFVDEVCIGKGKGTKTK